MFTIKYKNIHGGMAFIEGKLEIPWCPNIDTNLINYICHKEINLLSQRYNAENI